MFARIYVSSSAARLRHRAILVPLCLCTSVRVSTGSPAPRRVGFVELCIGKWERGVEHGPRV